MLLQAGSFHVLPAFDTKSTGLAYAVAAGAPDASPACRCSLAGRSRTVSSLGSCHGMLRIGWNAPAGDKARAVAAYEGKFIVRFGAKNSRFPQVSHLVATPV